MGESEREQWDRKGKGGGREGTRVGGRQGGRERERAREMEKDWMNGEYIYMTSVSILAQEPQVAFLEASFLAFCAAWNAALRQHGCPRQ